MRLLLSGILLASTRAAIVANDTDEYVRAWARAGEKDRCDAKNCDWMVGCLLRPQPMAGLRL